MIKGFYNLTSGMLSQGNRLDVIANNMTNVATAGYKSDSYTDTTFKEYMLNRVGNKDKSNPSQLGTASYILAPDKIYTDFTQGTMEQTGLPLDFGISGDGFFAVQTPEGTAYTRAGSFALDNEGYLCLTRAGRVLDQNGNTIYLGTDKIQADTNGTITSDDGTVLGKLGVFALGDTQQLQRCAQGLFTGGTPQASNATVMWKYVERANVDLMKQMTGMISAQRAFQSAAEVSKMYDELMTKAATNLGNV